MQPHDKQAIERTLVAIWHDTREHLSWCRQSHLMPSTVVDSRLACTRDRLLTIAALCGIGLRLN